MIAIRRDGREAPKLGPKWDFLHGEGHRPGHGNESLYITIRPTILFILRHITLTPHNYRGVTDGPVRHRSGEKEEVKAAAAAAVAGCSQEGG